MTGYTMREKAAAFDLLMAWIYSLTEIPLPEEVEPGLYLCTVPGCDRLFRKWKDERVCRTRECQSRRFVAWKCPESVGPDEAEWGTRYEAFMQRRWTQQAIRSRENLRAWKRRQRAKVAA